MKAAIAMTRRKLAGALISISSGALASNARAQTAASADPLQTAKDRIQGRQRGACQRADPNGNRARIPVQSVTMAELAPELFFATVAELSAKIAAREISAEELTRAFSNRLEQLGPRYNALALALPERAIRIARDIDREIKRGRLRGPLQGIPYGVKDLLSLAGQITTWGAKPYAAQVFDYTAAAIEKLDGSGAVLIGKLSMVELAGGGGYRLPSASLFGPGLNPWDRTRWSGGSSSGSATAVAAGLVPFALGLGNLRLHYYSSLILRRHRAPAHLWPGEPPRRHGALLDSG